MRAYYQALQKSVVQINQPTPTRPRWAHHTGPTTDKRIASPDKRNQTSGRERRNRSRLVGMDLLGVVTGDGDGAAVSSFSLKCVFSEVAKLVTLAARDEDNYLRRKYPGFGAFRIYCMFVHESAKVFSFTVLKSGGDSSFYKTMMSDDATAKRSLQNALNSARQQLKNPKKRERIEREINEAWKSADSVGTGTLVAAAAPSAGLLCPTGHISSTAVPVVPAAALTAVFGHLTTVEQHHRHERQETLKEILKASNNAFKAANEASNNALEANINSQKIIADISKKAIDALSPQKSTD
ncbi:hypothetical protein THAOC_35753 [Thalassiosira oceanica]|uniref:Uncharacterized protein n=1 Tax=Thalassiosira oceanica TaxID=159749 RepID=K0R194_THAOC|nr:hypothetical protein THAOC_35753 [Thalassiosira oceanica]|eukprot:EJK45625.1 hypothetical protein THAOC_35753 [Thalassiosira oceanica]